MNRSTTYASSSDTATEDPHEKGPIIRILKEAESGAKVIEVTREHGICAGTFCRWRAKSMIGAQMNTRSHALSGQGCSAPPAEPPSIKEPIAVENYSLRRITSPRPSYLLVARILASLRPAAQGSPKMGKATFQCPIHTLTASPASHQIKLAVHSTSICRRHFTASRLC